MRVLLVALFVFPFLAGLAPQVSAQDGCTPCECGVAYCEDGVTHWPVIEWVEVPDSVVFGETFEVAWRFTFDPPRENKTPVAPWGGGQAFLAANATHPGPEPATYPRAYPVHVNSSDDIVFPSEHRVNITLVGYEEYWLVAASDLPQATSTPVPVVVMPHADPPAEAEDGPATLMPEGPTERVDGVPALGLPLAIAAVWLAVRRWS